MNLDTIRNFLKENFIIDDIKKTDVVHENFKHYLHNICNNGSFYRYCCEQKLFHDQNFMKKIQKNIIKHDFIFNDEDLDDIVFIYNWFITNKIRKLLKKDVQFFIHIFNEIEL
jgi:hypothetical protein